MYLKKLAVMAVMAAVACVALAAWATFRPTAADEPKPADPPKALPVKGAPLKPANKMLVWKQQKAVLIDADGKNETVLFELGKGEGIREPRLSPDGKAVAYLSHTLDPSKPAEPGTLQRSAVVLRQVAGADVLAFPLELKLTGQMIAWSPDSKELLVMDFEERAESGPKDGAQKTTATVVDVATKKESTLAIPTGHMPTAFAPDGKKVVTMQYDISTGKPVLATCLVSRDGKEVTTLTDPAYLAMNGRLSPDGKAVLFMGMKAPDKVPEKSIDERPRLFIQPLGGKVAELPDVPLNAEIQGFCWSPDGKKIAYTWRTIHEEKADPAKPDERETESHLCVCDADGKNHKTILTEKGKGQWHITLGSVDWR